MNSTTGSTHDIAHTSSVMMWVLVTFAVLFLFGTGTILHRAYRRWAGAPSPTEDSHVHPSSSRASQAIRAMKVSFPASGVTKGRVHVGREDTPLGTSPSSSKTMPVK